MIDRTASPLCATEGRANVVVAGLAGPVGTAFDTFGCVASSTSVSAASEDDRR